MAMRIGLLSLLFSILVTTAAAAAPSDGGDEAALLAFKENMSERFGVLASWNRSANFCSWEGVTCSRGNPTRVLSLDLHSRTLTGTISPAIGNLTFLQTLNLSSNKLSGEIPSSIGRLRRLEALDLGNNSLHGTIPTNLSLCANMKSLQLNDNHLHGSLPAELGNMLMLQVLDLSNNSLTGVIPRSFANLSSLLALSMQQNYLQGTVPSGLGDNAHLRYLSLAYNNLSGVLPHSLYNLSSIRVFNVAVNQLHGSLPTDAWNNFRRLETFYLAYNRFTGVIPSPSSNLSTLWDFNIGSNNFTGALPRTLGRWRALRYLSLDDNQFEAKNQEEWEFFTSLTNCSELQHLLLSDNRFEGELPESMANLSRNLQWLYLEHNKISGSIPSGIGNLVNLEVIDLSNNFLTGAIPESIGKLTNLVELGLYSNNLSGLIPASMGNLTQLTRLYAYYNNLEGPIPASLGSLRNLFVLDLSTNYRLNGSIPKEIFGLPSLSWYLDLSYNSLVGSLPSEVGSLVNLNQLILSGNNLSGEIPDNLGNCIVLESILMDRNSFQGSIPPSLKNIKGLAILNLTMNKLSGTIPNALGSIGNLQQLSLAHNNLSGPVPATLQNSTTLFQLDLSFNNLQGEVPGDGIFRNLTGLSIAGNNMLCGGIPQLHLPACSIPTASNNRKGHPKSLTVALPAAGAILFFISALVAAWLLCTKLEARQRLQSSPPSIQEQHPRIPYHALLKATDGFSEANLLGKGGYGVVYKGTLDNQSTAVAVKVFNLRQSGSSKSFEAECDALRRVRHRCLIKIITCCSSIDSQGQEFKALVFEFMPNGSLDDWLHSKLGKPASRITLSLAQRLNIAVDIADALDYLHNNCQPPIVHCDLKPSNILLARDMSARVGDFGIARILPEPTSNSSLNSNGSMGIRGSIGYVAPEYGEGCTVSTYGDAYSFGIMLLEMFTGRSPTDDMFKDTLNLHKFAETALPERVMEIADPTIWLHAEMTDINVDNGSIVRSRIEECLVSVVGLGISCSKQLPRERILIRDAAIEMRAIRDAYFMFSSLLIAEEGRQTTNRIDPS